MVLVYSLLAKRLTKANITGPMLSVIAGIAVFSLIGPGMNAATLQIVAELTLVIVLFHDASTVKLAQLRRDPGIAVRLLLIGFPLALVAAFPADEGVAAHRRDRRGLAVGRCSHTDGRRSGRTHHPQPRGPCPGSPQLERGERA